MLRTKWLYSRNGKSLQYLEIYYHYYVIDLRGNMISMEAKNSFDKIKHTFMIK